MKSRPVFLLALFVFLLINQSQAFAITENFSVLPNQQKTIDVLIEKNQKIFFQIFVEGGDNNDIRLKIIDTNSNFVYFNGIIRESKSNTDYSPIFEAYKSEISNDDAKPKNLSFIFDNTLTTSSNKNVDFTYVVTSSGEIFEQPEFLSWIHSLIIIVIVIVAVIVVIVVIIKKLKQRELDKN